MKTLRDWEQTVQQMIEDSNARAKGIGHIQLTARSAASKDELASLRSTIESLQHENQRLFLRLVEYEGKMAKMQAEIEERDKRIEVLETSLRDATQSRADRERRIQELETELGALQGKVKELESRRRGAR